MRVYEKDFDTALKLKHFIYEEMLIADEYEDCINTIKKFLQWSMVANRPSYDHLYSGDIGVFYIIAGILHRNKIITYGVSIRQCFIDTRGIELLAAINKFSAEDILIASGMITDSNGDDFWYDDESPHRG